MSAFSIRAASACIPVLFLGTLSAQIASEAGPAPEVSKVRIVRLSEVKGVVQLDRNTGRGYEAVLTNLPIVEHSRLQTAMGVAEVEFEDNSTLRLAPNSIVEFTQLDRLATGTTVSSMRLVQGMAYVSMLKTKGNEFNVLFGQQKVQLPPSSHIRLQVNEAQATLAVLDGTVNIDGPEGPGIVSRKNTLTFQIQNQEAAPTVAKNVVPTALDAWDKDAVQRHAQTASNSAFGSPYSYGVADMAYYGAFTSAAGCGTIWRPYFASAAWNPYGNGVWAWYPGAGYSWVSPYPWGWTPFHMGSWSYCNGVGWGWQPGGSWNGLNNVTTLVTPGGGNAIAAGGGGTGVGNGGPVRPPRPVRPPVAGASTLSVVSTQPLVRSQAVTSDSFVFRKDSAGLGVPRDGMGKLNRLSQDTIHRGEASTPIYTSAPSSAMRSGRPGEGRSGNAQAGNEAIVPTAIHRGAPPQPNGQMPSERGGGNGESRSAMRSGAESSGQPSGGMSQPSIQPVRPMPQSMPQQAPQPMPQQSQPMSAPSGGSAPSASPAQGRPR
jgi:hypothetical protein